MTWLERHFCTRLSSRIKELQEENAALRGWLGKSEESAKELDEKLQRCIEKRKELRAEIKKQENDAAWFKDRLKTLEKALEDAMVIPEFDVDESELVVYRFEGKVFMGYDLRAADLEYYQLPYDAWIELLAEVQREVGKSLTKWRVNVSDCDDWAYVMGATVVQAFVKAGLDRQGAFMILWDMTGEQKHAYNGFMDTDGQVWVYEPQNGTVVGKLGETSGAYETDWIWFPGSQPT